MADNPAPAKREPTFTTAPARAIADRRLHETDFRVLLTIALFDRRSLARGKGAGCFVSLNKLAERADMQSRQLRRSVDRLVKFGYVERSPRGEIWQGYVLRVIEEGEDSGVRTPKDSAVPTPTQRDEESERPRSPHLGTGETSPRALTGAHNKREVREHLKDSAKAACALGSAHGDDETGEQDNVIPLYRPLGDRADDFLTSHRVDREALAANVRAAIGALGSGKALSELTGVTENYISQAKNGRRVSDAVASQLACSILRHFDSDGLLGGLPSEFFAFPPEKQLPILERALDRIDGTELDPLELDLFDAFLGTVWDRHTGQQLGGWAERLMGKLHETSELPERSESE